jgi:hypothetical protein
MNMLDTVERKVLFRPAQVLAPTERMSPLLDLVTRKTVGLPLVRVLIPRRVVKSVGRHS